MIHLRFLTVAAAALLCAALLAACGGDRPATDLHPLELVAASPAVREAWETQKARLAGPAPEAPREAEVRLYYHLLNLTYDPRRLEIAADHLFGIWREDPANPLWIELALTRRRALGRTAETDTLLGAATESSRAAAEYIRARRAWSRNRADSTLFLPTIAAAAEDPLTRIWASMKAARTEQESGNADGAIARLLGLLPDAWATGGAALAGNVWGEIDVLARRQERYDDALLAAHAAEICARASGNGFVRVQAALAIGKSHLARCEFHAAQDTFLACRQVSVDSSFYRWVKHVDGLLARSARASGDAEIERAQLLLMRETTAATADTNGLIRVRVALGNVERRLGRWDEAAARLDEAGAANAAWSGADLRSLIDLEWANLLGQQGRYAAVESLLTTLSADFYAGPDDLAIMEVRITLIRQGLETDRPDLAYRALAEARKIDPHRLPRSAAYDPLLQLEIVAARLHARQGEHHLATAALDRVWDRLDRASPDAAWFLFEARALVATAAADHQTARESWITCDRLAREANDPQLLRRSRVQLGATLVAEGAYAAAESLFTADLTAREYWPRLNANLLAGMCRVRTGDLTGATVVLATVDSMIGPDAPRDILSRLRMEQGRIAAARGRPEDALAHLVAARHSREVSLPGTRTDIGRAFNTGIEREIAEETLALLQSNWERQPTEDLWQESRALAAWGRGSVGTTASVTSPERARVEYFVGDEHVYAWVMAVNGAPAAWVRLGDIDGRLADLVDAVQVDMSYPGRAVDTKAAAELGRRLLGPALASWAPETTLEILPDGPLAGLPWAALVLPTGTPVIERGSIVFVTGSRRRARATATGDALLVLGADGDPTTEQRLVRAEAEAEAVAALWPGEIDLRLGTDARWPELREGGARGFRAIHIATHTRVYEGLDGRSTIHMAGLDSAAPLTLPEIPSLGVEAEIVYLSSCEGARRHRSVGRGVTSFAEAFLEAGADAVIASTVLMDDEAASALALAFYRHWLGGKERAAALRAALLELREADPAWEHPFYWGFTNLHRTGG